jgi:hypothetical protein
MKKEKQIIEIKECIDAVYGADCAYFDVDGFAIANEIYNAGYRKQSENTVEVVRCKECRNCEKVPSILGTVLYCNEWCKDVAEGTFCSFGAKMKGGAE